MGKYIGPKCRLCRASGIKLFLKGERCYTSSCPLEKKGAVPPGQHGPKRKTTTSDYGRQLKEKQKLKRLYQVSEEQFRRYFQKSLKAKGKETGLLLLQALERRLDNVVYRLGFAPSRSVARQLVSHGHVLVNNKKVDIPSYEVKVGDVISLRPKSLEIEVVKKSLAEKDRKIPEWLKREATVGKIERLPTREEMETEIDESLIVEFYSR